MGRRNATAYLAIIIIGLFLLLPACSKAQPQSPPAQSAPAPTPNHSPLVIHTVSRVIDGDTIELEDGTKVRYIGIDTPETKHPKKPVQYYGKEAAEENRKLVDGQRVTLEYDVQQTDKYGRTLAYVYLTGHDTYDRKSWVFVNAWLVEWGYARVSTYPPNVRYQDKFLELERKAKEERRGLWGKQ